jgi:hypothetical protein
MRIPLLDYRYPISYCLDVLVPQSLYLQHCSWWRLFRWCWSMLASPDSFNIMKKNVYLFIPSASFFFTSHYSEFSEEITFTFFRSTSGAEKQSGCWLAGKLCFHFFSRKKEEDNINIYNIFRFLSGAAKSTTGSH